ncbi:M1 family metallopeptidase [Rhodotorula paludigena]|uniref:M1 family metallopeptidase n=1 Tax=Rhodotorula paludigena TaxID=86838 RepID=UPI00317D62FA
MSVTPSSYSLVIKTSFPSSFSGVAEIQLVLSEPSSTITVNAAAPLRLLGAVLVKYAERFPARSVELDEEEELATLDFGRDVPAGEAILALRLEGRLDQSGMQGYYRVAAGESDFYAVTQFQATSARKAFPCFDHPAKKATFSISLISPAGLNSLSNTPVAQQIPSDGRFTETAACSFAFLSGDEGFLAAASPCCNAADAWELVAFKPTPPMSTYVVAWAVGFFDFISSQYTSPLTGAQVPLRLYASTAREHLKRGQGQRALDTLSRVMPVYEKLFELPYELGKLDMLVVDEFEAGAMENYGLVTGRAVSLLYDEERSGDAALRQVVTTVSHEAAHMWFGNSTTLSWWDELWLNESFATLIGEIVAIRTLEPSWNVDASFIKFHRSTALQIDALRGSHPIHLLCKHETEIAQNFDHISYEKGSAVLKMLCDVIGEERFLAGTAAYLKKNNNIDVGAFMATWIEEVGFPVITVEEIGDSLKLRQNRFLATGDLKVEEDEAIWSIPLFVRDAASGASAGIKVFDTRELVIPKPGLLYLLNTGSRSFVRIAYPPSHLANLAAEAGQADSKLALSDRLAVVEDSLLLAEAGYTHTVPTLDFLSTFASHETDFLVWAELTGAFKRFADAWWEESAAELTAFRAFGRKLFRPIVDLLGLKHRPEDDPETRRFRALVVAAAAAVEDVDLLCWVQQAFGGLLAGESDLLAAHLAMFVVAAAVQHGRERDYEAALAIFREPPTPQHQIAAIAGLCNTRQPELIQRTAAMLSGGEVKADLFPHFLHGLAANPSARRLVWSLVQQAWPQLEQQFRGSMLLGSVAAASFQSFSSESDALAVEAFFANKDTTAYAQPLHQGLDLVRAKSRWLEREKHDVRAWLDKEGYLRQAGEEQVGDRDSGFAQ